MAVAVEDRRAYARAYRAAPAAARRAINAVCRAGGRATVEGDLEPFGAHRDGDDWVLPLELVFETPLNAAEPACWVEALMLLGPAELRAVARERGVAAVDDAVVLRARLYEDLRARGLDGADLRVLERVAAAGGEVRLRDFLDGASKKPVPVADLFGAAPALRLVRAMLLVPLPAAPGSGLVDRLAIPAELRGRIVPRAPEADEVRGVGPTFWRETAAALLVLEQERVKVTQQRRPNQTDVKRVAKRLRMEPGRAAWQYDVAAEFGWLSIAAGRVRVAPAAAALLDAEPAARRAALKKLYLRSDKQNPFSRYAGWYRDEDPGDGLWLEFRVAMLEAVERGDGPVAAADLRADLAKRFKSSKVKQALYWLPGNVGPFLDRAFDQALTRLVTLGLADAGMMKGEVVWLRRTAPAPEPPRGAAKLVVQPNLEILAPAETPFSDLLNLARFAALRTIDAASIFELSRASLTAALNDGRDAEAFRAWLVERARDPLPQPVRFLLDEAAARAAEVEIVPCNAVVKVKNPALLKMLAANRKLRGAIAPQAEAIGLALGDPQALVEAIRKLGYVVKAPAVQTEDAAGGPAIPRRPTPGGGSRGHCVCSRTSDPAGIDERIEDAIDENEPLEVWLLDGRRHVLSGVDQDPEGFVEGTDDGGEFVRVARERVASARVVH